MSLFLARLPAGSARLQIYEVERPVLESMQSEPAYTPRAWAYCTRQSEGIAALDDTPVKATKRLAAHKKLADERRALTEIAFV